MTLTANVYLFSYTMEAIILTGKNIYKFLNFHIRSSFHFTIIAITIPHMTTKAKLDEKALEENRCKYKFSIWHPIHVTSWCCCKLYPLGCVNIFKAFSAVVNRQEFFEYKAILGLGRAAGRGVSRI